MKNIVFHLLLALSLISLAACERKQAPDSLDAKTHTVEQEAATPENAIGAPSGRLSGAARPVAYRLDLTLDPRRDSFGGRAAIDVELAEESDTIWLHGKDLRVSNVVALMADDDDMQGTYEEVLDSGVAAIRFAEELPAGMVTLRIDYEADFDRNLAGLFKVEEQGEAYALAKSESIQARKYLPGFDEPGMKATFDIALTVPAGYAAISNGAELERVDAGNGMEKVTFARTRPMSTYLLSLSVGPFDVVERPAIPANEFRDFEIPLRGFARKGRGGDMNYILDITPRMLEVFEQELKRPYPFKKLDIIAAPQWPSGATELSAAITYREQRILVGDNPAPGARLSLVGIHAHELAHMWFGNLVTPPWWDDLWLKEGFATWGTPLALTIMEPEGGHDVNAAVSALSGMVLDSLASTRAIREPITENHDIRNAYDAITYRKSLGVIHMVDQFFGPDIFRPALGRYIARFADGIADSPEFYEIIAKETGTPELTETFRSFVEQKGVPLLEMELRCEPGKASVRMKQSRYRPLGSPIADKGQRWNIPVVVRLADGKEARHLLTEAQSEIPLQAGNCPQWILPNASGSGYYRWTLPPRQWDALLAGFDKLSHTEALAVIDSAFAAFEAGKLKPATLLKVVEVSAQSRNRNVLMQPLNRLARLKTRYFDEDAAARLASMADRLYGQRLTQLAGSADAEDKLLYSQLLAFMAKTAGSESARKLLAEKARAFTGYGVTKDESALPSDLYQPALTVALQDLDAGFLGHLLKVRKEMDNPLFENASANALGTVRNPEQLKQLQALILGEELGSREAFGLIQHALEEPALRDRHWAWVQDNFEAISKKVPGQWRRRMPNFALSFCDKDKLKELQDLFGEYGKLAPGHERALSQAEERIQLCMAQKEQGESLARAIGG
ncbi:M1 family metallopeptidase [Biformimicrobium ophioploci]|uniref:Aminopeptidase n=1 Tax=Biformimicrobium ophioploci TaxID=3036711 RepID=A0ABQ6M0H2_9GAMM|nr:M1 family metallopeptidase [Microbulbifer sp. NKW57]GMG87818.1 M1 family metallopeptidase [Microbulbifer sp. NKW57]